MIKTAERLERLERDKMSNEKTELVHLDKLLDMMGINYDTLANLMLSTTNTFEIVTSEGYTVAKFSGSFMVKDKTTR